VSQRTLSSNEIINKPPIRFSFFYVIESNLKLHVLSTLDSNDLPS